jgi:hypothetical protein
MANARGVLEYQATDPATGNASAGASVYVFEMDGTTPIGQVMYSSLAGSATLTNPLTSDTTGLVRAYVTTPQRVLVRVGSGTFYTAAFQPDPTNIPLTTGGTLTSPTITDAITLTQVATSPQPTAPAAGFDKVFAGTDGHLYIIKPSGAPIQLIEKGQAAIVVGDIAPGAASTALLTNAGATAMVLALIANANVDPAAAIALSKLAPGAANTVVATNAGATALAASLLVNANVDPAAAITVGKLAAGSTGQVPVTVAGVPTWTSATLSKNLIVNGTGRTKQRGTMPTTDNSYAIDRMRLLMENANGFTITQETTTLPTAPGANYGYRFTVGAGNNGKGGGFWPVVAPDMEGVAGGLLSLQAQFYISHVRLANLRMGIAQFTGTADAISGDPVSAWGADGTNPTLAASWSFADTPVSLALSATTFTQKFSQNVSISSSAKNVAVLIWNDARTTTAADFFIVTDIQLERGAACTAVERTPEPIERALCLDWLEVIKAAATTALFATGVITSATTGALSIRYLPKRIAPTLSTSTLSDFQLQDGSVAPSATVLSLAGATAVGQCSLNVTAGGGGLTTGRGGGLFSANTNATLTLSSEP